MTFRCEDYPCCGHELGDCPNPNPRKGFSGFRCVECGQPLRKNWPKSQCHRKSCQRDFQKKLDRMYAGEYFYGDA